MIATGSVMEKCISGTLWGHLVDCWACGFDYTQSVSYTFNFTERTFITAMQACDDDYDAYLYEHHRTTWREYRDNHRTEGASHDYTPPHR